MDKGRKKIKFRIASDGPRWFGLGSDPPSLKLWRAFFWVNESGAAFFYSGLLWIGLDYSGLVWITLDRGEGLKNLKALIGFSRLY